MKRFLFFFFIFLASVSLFFFSISNASAYTYNFVITEDMIDFVSDSRFISSITTKSGSWNPVSYSSYDTSSSSWKYYYTDFNPDTSYSLICSHISSVDSLIYCSSSPAKNHYPYIINSDYSFSQISRQSAFSIQLSNIYNHYSIIYSPAYTFSYIYTNRDDTINITDGTNNFSCSVNSTNTTCILPTVYSWYLDYYSTPPEPPDDTPILTSFIDLVINKLSYICDFISSSYIYLSIFVIFILYICILFLRRL